MRMIKVAEEKKATQKKTVKNEKSAENEKKPAKKTTVKKDKVLEKTKELIKGKKKPTFRGRFGKKQCRRKSNDKWDKWRRPRGIDIRRKKEDGSVVDIGYRTDKKIRNLHPCGLAEVRVNNVAELETLKGVAVRISGTVGKKKKQEILKKAEEMKLKVING